MRPVSRFEYQLSSVAIHGFSLPGIIRFPYLAIKYGVGKFIKFYLVASILVILPILVLEKYIFAAANTRLRRRAKSLKTGTNCISPLQVWKKQKISSWTLGTGLFWSQFFILSMIMIIYSSIFHPILVFNSLPQGGFLLPSNQTCAEQIDVEQWKAENTGAIPDFIDDARYQRQILKEVKCTFNHSDLVTASDFTKDIYKSYITNQRFCSRKLPIKFFVISVALFLVSLVPIIFPFIRVVSVIAIVSVPCLFTFFLVVIIHAFTIQNSLDNTSTAVFSVNNYPNDQIFMAAFTQAALQMHILGVSSCTYSSVVSTSLNFKNIFIDSLVSLLVSTSTSLLVTIILASLNLHNDLDPMCTITDILAVVNLITPTFSPNEVLKKIYLAFTMTAFLISAVLTLLPLFHYFTMNIETKLSTLILKNAEIMSSSAKKLLENMLSVLATSITFIVFITATLTLNCTNWENFSLTSLENDFLPFGFSLTNLTMVFITANLMLKRLSTIKKFYKLCFLTLVFIGLIFCQAVILGISIRDLITKFGRGEFEVLHISIWIPVCFVFIFPVLSVMSSLVESDGHDSFKTILVKNLEFSISVRTKATRYVQGEDIPTPDDPITQFTTTL